MIRRWSILALASLSLFVVACRAQHLGSGYGRTYRNAFHVQAVNHTAEAPAPQAPQDAHDARRALGAHRGGGKKKGPADAVGGFALQPMSIEAK
jgi:hypothetical protein